MKKFVISFTAVLTILSSMFVFCMPTYAATNYYQGWAGHPEESVLIDNVGLFTDEQFNDLNRQIQECSQDLEMNIVIYVSKSYMSDYSTEIFADDTYDEMFGEDTDGVFYYMDFSGKKPAYDYISTSGKAVLFYQSHVESIFSSMDAYLPPSSVSNYKDYSDDIALGVECFLGKLRSYAENAQNPLTYYKDESSGKYFYYKNGELVVTKSMPLAKRLMIFGVALLVGLLVTLISYLIGKSSYKFKPSTNANVYIEKEEIKRKNWEDHFLRTYTTKTRIESSSGSRGGHGGGGHHHSGGHGGGGHHR